MKVLRLLLGMLGLGGSVRPAGAAAASASPYLGEIMLFTGPYVPAGWVPCDGRLLAIADHGDLFTVIGTIYGGDGVINFAVPDLRGSLPLHQGSSAGSNFSMGERAGNETVTLLATQMPVHSHTAGAHSGVGSSSDATGLVPARDAAGSLHYAAVSDATADSSALATAGGSQAHNNMQPYLTLNYCIALVGIYPPQN